jgi:hypothetical protein
MSEDRPNDIRSDVALAERESGPSDAHGITQKAAAPGESGLSMFESLSMAEKEPHHDRPSSQGCPLRI